MLVHLPVRRFVTNAALIIMTVGGVLAAAPAWGRSVFSDDVALVYAPMIGVLIAAPAFWFLCVGVRCVRCSYKLFWHAVAKQQHPTGLSWFFQATACPNCGYTRESQDGNPQSVG
jgi:hypothetical protein